MKKILIYVLAVLVCWAVFTLFCMTGVGVFFMALFYNTVIKKIWYSITKFAKSDKSANQKQPSNDEKKSVEK